MTETDLCFGCRAKTSTECFILIKEKDGNMNLFSITPENCICRECIVKMMCEKFCDRMESLVPTIGTKIDV
jgi:hypothetical protein